MIIHQPELTREKGQIVLRARIEWAQDHGNPAELWFSVEEEDAPEIAARADIFLSSLIRVARAHGEDIEVHGALSPQLLFGMREYLKTHAAWSGNPKVIEIHAKNPIPAPTKTDGGASCNISGGIDSFYTLWSKLPQNEPAAQLRLRCGIFGIGLSSPERSDVLRRQYIPYLKHKLETLQVRLLVVDTNANEFSHPDPWLALSTCRIALPQLFSSAGATHFLPSSDSYRHAKPAGNHPMTDHLFSTEGTRIFTHGAELIRLGKLARIKDWGFIHDLLQVCNFPSAEQINDCRCKKCLRTLAALEVYGVREKFTTFQRNPTWKYSTGRIVLSENMYADFSNLARYAWRHRRYGALAKILFPMAAFKMTGWAKPLLGYKYR